jgi:small-conductance mechanosensitive channel
MKARIGVAQSSKLRRAYREVMSTRSSVVAAFCAGAALGALVMWATRASSQSAAVASSDEIEQATARNATEVKSLGERVARIETRLDETQRRFEAHSSSSADRREQVQPSSNAGHESAASGSAPSSSQSIAIHDTQWTTVLDGYIAQCLVEHGLTPFVSGVAGPVKEAGDAMRAESSRYGEEMARLNKLASSTPGLSESFDANTARNTKTRKQILDRLSAALDALKK